MTRGVVYREMSEGVQETEQGDWNREMRQEREQEDWNREMRQETEEENCGRRRIRGDRKQNKRNANRGTSQETGNRTGKI